MTACDTRACKVCGKTFVPKTSMNVYCSYECAREANRRNARKQARRSRADTFDGGVDPDESAMQAVWVLDDETRKRLRLLFAPRIRDAIRIWMKDGR